MNSESPPKIAIIGAGFAGLCIAIRLKAVGIHDFTIFEKGNDLGGTWRDNLYPGAACDIPSFSYCFSFEQKADWSRKWAPQAEILAYMRHCAEKYAILPHIRFGAEVQSARFDAETGAWSLRMANGESEKADFVVSCVGQLNRPHYPTIVGMENFAGVAFHSARWNLDCELSGKCVAVIGNAATAVQLVPEIARRTKMLYVFQRSPHWILPMNNRTYTHWEKWLFSVVPGFALLYRLWLWLMNEITFPIMLQKKFASRKATSMAMGHLKRQVMDPQLRQMLTPNYPIGAKRILLTDDYYLALQQRNVRLITSAIDRVTPDVIVTREGSEYGVDVIILATGFETTSFLVPMRIQGIDGRSLHETWADKAEAYLGISVAGFPNFFLMYGPNTNLGHNSIIFMLECQTRYIIDCILKTRRMGIKYIDVRADVMTAYNKRLQMELARTVWTRTQRSWYRTKSGRITNNWPGFSLSYWWQTRRVNLDLYHQVYEDR